MHVLQKDALLPELQLFIKGSGIRATEVLLSEEKMNRNDGSVVFS